MLTFFVRLLKILNSEDSPYQIALAIWFGLLITFFDLFNPLMWCVLLVVCVVRVNLTAFLAAWGGFTLLMSPFTSLLDQFGLMILTHESIVPSLQAIHQVSWVSLLQLGYSVVMGGVALSLALLIPFLLMLPWLIRRYRAQMMPWVEKTRLVQALKSSKFFQMYQEL